MKEENHNNRPITQRVRHKFFYRRRLDILRDASPEKIFLSARFS